MPTDEQYTRFQSAYQSLQTIAVTGTNGKTTTTSMIDAIVRASGSASARLTTLGAFVNGRAIDVGDHSSEFLHTVESAIAAGVKTFALEVTSKALMGGWGQRWPAHVAVYTNISRDHMDMHESPEAYLAAKAQLFMSVAERGISTMGYEMSSHCVLNAADENVGLIAETIPPHAKIHYYSAAPLASGPDLVLGARSVTCSRDGIVLSLADSELASGLGGELRLPIVGEVHASNALAAALASHCAGYSADAIVTGLASFRGVPGRFEVVSMSPLTVVDYAHTPDGLRGTLVTARQLVGHGGQLHVVFGCGGERDPGKRAEMGRVAHQLADTALLTNDNPRRENPESIAADIRLGASGPGAIWSVCLDRALAIDTIVLAANESDVIIIAGKGHESTQEIAGRTIPMCDVKTARTALAQRPSC